MGVIVMADVRMASSYLITFTYSALNDGFVNGVANLASMDPRSHLHKSFFLPRRRTKPSSVIMSRNEELRLETDDRHCRLPLVSAEAC